MIPQELIDLPEDKQVKEFREFLTHDNHYMCLDMQGRQNMWVEYRTRKNMFYVYKYIALGAGKQKRFTIMELTNALSMKYESCRHALFILCYMREAKLTWKAWKIVDKETKKVKIIQQVMLK